MSAVISTPLDSFYATTTANDAAVTSTNQLAQNRSVDLINSSIIIQSTNNIRTVTVVTTILADSLAKEFPGNTLVLPNGADLTTAFKTILVGLYQGTPTPYSVQLVSAQPQTQPNLLTNIVIVWA